MSSINQKVKYIGFFLKKKFVLNDSKMSNSARNGE